MNRPYQQIASVGISSVSAKVGMDHPAMGLTKIAVH